LQVLPFIEEPNDAYIIIDCAVIDHSNENMILTSDVLARLELCERSNNVVSCNTVDAPSVSDTEVKTLLPSSDDTVPNVDQHRADVIDESVDCDDVLSDNVGDDNESDMGIITHGEIFTDDAASIQQVAEKQQSDKTKRDQIPIIPTQRYDDDDDDDDVNLTNSSDVVDVKACAVVYESGKDIGELEPVPVRLITPDCHVPPSTKIKLDDLKHLTKSQQTKLLDLLACYPGCLSDFPDFSDVTSHAITLKDGFRPRHISAYRVPERLRPMVNSRVQEMLDHEIICPPSGPIDNSPECIYQGVSKNKVTSVTGCREVFGQLVRPPEYPFLYRELCAG